MENGFRTQNRHVCTKIMLLTCFKLKIAPIARSKMAAKMHFNAQEMGYIDIKSALISLVIQNNQWKMALGHRTDTFVPKHVSNSKFSKMAAKMHFNTQKMGYIDIISALISLVI